jgi:hypothetical protein
MTLALQSYLMAYAFWVAVALGGMALAMLHQLVGGRWGDPVRPALAAMLQTLPLFALLVVPLLAGIPELYVWSHLDDVVVAHKRGYLNAPFFIARSLGYVVTWSALALPLSRSAVPQRRRAGIGLVLLFLTATFAATDWLQSLEPHWHSTIYGLLFLSAAVLAGTAFAVLVSARKADARALQDLGNLLLASVMLLAYMSLSQLIIIWSGNLPDENGWYLARKQPGWLIGATVLSAIAVPFTLLLSRAVKRNPRRMMGVAVLLLAGAAAHMFWLIAPAFHRPALFSWTDLVAWLVVGGVWVSVFAWRLRSLS